MSGTDFPSNSASAAETAELAELAEFLKRVPAIGAVIDFGKFSSGRWWAKFDIDISHPLAWSVVQELGHVLNYLTPEERLPTVFMPVSPPPYANGGPTDFLHWVIESETSEFGPRECKEWLEGRLPKPVENQNEWIINV